MHWSQSLGLGNCWNYYYTRPVDAGNSTLRGSGSPNELEKEGRSFDDVYRWYFVSHLHNLSDQAANLHSVLLL